ncbi:hypothetical protein QJS10_CPA03g00256 [Acorus calamus]|uniref:Timeless N-terminal domain-containing protein n=1 Tax=Acorus calamus TaxID=4465 RepID=A0AAV9CCH9_ACOCL|nr:hypothetical protein QJS10_CPB20g02113 [Acorus calamus]KAK1286795.1 hypothetical protein QJS10_CPB20g02111 [Acorus calamus]KAK1320266.1 hypothetical protein QJS10_CPA03g00256 [Acorus calamus]
MDVAGLSAVCVDLGFAQEDENGATIGYVKSDFCLDNLKDLQRFLRRDDPQTRDVFKQLCKWNTVSRNLIPIIEAYQNDHNLVVNAVKVLVFLTMPIDPASDDVIEQIEYLWSLKAVMTRNVTIAVIVALLEDPLEHLEQGEFTEDDWKLVQLVLTLFRNVLAIQEISVQQKASGSVTQFLFLRDRFLELLFHENVMDLILVLTQHLDGSCRYLHQDNLLLLEIFHYTFLGQDPELIVKARRKASKVDEDISASLNSLQSMMEEENKKRLVRLRNLERKSQLNGAFTRMTLDGSKSLIMGNPSALTGDGLLKPHKTQRGPVKKIVWDHETLSLPKENLLRLVYEFTNQFLSRAYNGESIREDIEKEHHMIQNGDVVVFFQVVHFVTTFQHWKFSILKAEMEDAASKVSREGDASDSTAFYEGICGPIAATMNEAMFLLVISKWRYAYDSLKETRDYKFLSTTGSLMKNMIRILDLVLKLSPEDSREAQTARILLYKLFYDQTEQGMTQFLLNLFRSFDAHKQPRSDLADMVEMIHITLRLMEKLQACGTLRVAKKSRKVRKRKAQRDSNPGEGKKPKEEHAKIQSADNSDGENEESTSQLKTCLSNSGSNEKEGTAAPDLFTEPDMPSLDIDHLCDGAAQTNEIKINNDIDDLAYETEDSSDDAPTATNEVDFNVSKLVANTRKECHYISAEGVSHDLGDLKRKVANWEDDLVGDEVHIGPSNGKSRLAGRSLADALGEDEADLIISEEIIFQDDEDLSSRHTQEKEGVSRKKKNLLNKGNLTELEPGKDSKRKRRLVFDDDQEDMIRELYERYKDDWKCSRLIAEALDPDGKVSPVQVSCKLKQLGLSVASRKKRLRGNGILPALDDNIAVDSRETTNAAFHKSSNELEDGSITRNSKYDKHYLVLTELIAFNKEQELMIKQLFEQFKNHKRCSHMIATALDAADKTYTAGQISRKLKQLGLYIPQEKRSSGTFKVFEDNEYAESEEKSDEETLFMLMESSKRKNKKTNKGVVVAIASEDNLETSTLQKDHSVGALSPIIERPFSSQNNEVATISVVGVINDGLDSVESRRVKNVMERDVSTEQNEPQPSQTNANIPNQVDVGSSSDEMDHQPHVMQSQDEIADELADSGDDVGINVSTNRDTRRKFRIVIDDEDEE